MRRTSSATVCLTFESKSPKYSLLEVAVTISRYMTAQFQWNSTEENLDTGYTFSETWSQYSTLFNSSYRVPSVITSKQNKDVSLDILLSCIFDYRVVLSINVSYRFRLIRRK